MIQLSETEFVAETDPRAATKCGQSIYGLLPLLKVSVMLGPKAGFSVHTLTVNSECGPLILLAPTSTLFTPFFFLSHTEGQR